MSSDMLSSARRRICTNRTANWVMGSRGCWAIDSSCCRAVCGSLDEQNYESWLPATDPSRCVSLRVVVRAMSLRYSRGVSSSPSPSGGVATGGNWPPFRNDPAKRGRLPMVGRRMILGELEGSGDFVVARIVLKEMTPWLG